MHGPALRLLPPRVERVAHARARAPESRNRRSSWCRRTPPRACPFRNRPLEVVPPNGISRCVCAVDAAGDDIHARRVDHLVRGIGRQPRRDLLDPSRLRSARRPLVVSVARSPPCRSESALSFSHRCLPAVRCCPRSPARLPVSTCSIVMQFSTGHTSQHKLQPTHSASSTARNALDRRRRRVRDSQSSSESASSRSAPRLATSTRRRRRVPVQMDALVRAVPARDVTEIAADALVRD